MLLTRRQACSAALALPAMLLAAGCDAQTDQGDAGGPAPESEPETVTSTDVMSVDGLYVNDGYTSEENDQLKLLYLLYTLHPAEENLRISSSSTELTINDKNSYSSERRSGACSLMSSYYYKDFIEDVYMGDELKVAETFEVPEADLEAGRSITLANSSIPDIDQILLSTDDITRCESAEQIAQTADPEGYAEAQRLREPADEATVATVSNAINGYYWAFVTNNISYRIEFYAPNRYTLSSMGVETTGTYQVTNGFVVCTNDSTGAVNEIPYTLDGTSVDLDPATGFSVYEN